MGDVSSSNAAPRIAESESPHQERPLRYPVGPFAKTPSGTASASC